MKYFFVVVVFFFTSCSDVFDKNYIYEDKAREKGIEKNCNPEIELLLVHDKTELWASYHNKDKNLLCVFTCVNDVCMFSTERD
tara:strand:+ start:901 stop:1149 length:249 start_codon:yes stop_codon:yes gene_type:complete